MVGRYYANRSTQGWAPPPDGVTYAELDRDTGALADSTTAPDKRYFEFFLEGTEPEPLRDNPWKAAQWGPFLAPRLAPSTAGTGVMQQGWAKRPWSPPASSRP